MFKKISIALLCLAPFFIALLLFYTYNKPKSIITLHENGKIKESGYVKNNNKHGLWKIYSPEGFLIEEITYKKDKKNGPWKEYYQSGAVKKIGSYKNGLREGLYKSFYENEVVQLEGIWKNGQATGIWKEYYASGALERTEDWEDGKIYSSTDYNEDGSEIVRSMP